MLLRYKLLVGANILFCCVGAATKQLPAWRMFERVDSFEISLTDRNGIALNIYDYLSRDTYIYNVKLLPQILTFVCTKERARAPLLFREKIRNIQLSLGPDDCEVHAKFQ